MLSALLCLVYRLLSYCQRRDGMKGKIMVAMSVALLVLAMVLAMVLEAITVRAAPPPETTVETIPEEKAGNIKDGKTSCEDDLMVVETVVTTTNNGDKIVEKTTRYKLSDMPGVAAQDVSLEGARGEFLTSGILETALKKGGDVRWEIIEQTPEKTKVKVTLLSREGREKVVYQTTEALLKPDQSDPPEGSAVVKLGVEEGQVARDDYEYFTSYETTYPNKEGLFNTTPHALKEWIAKK